jgi:hypothetical protein
MADLVLDTCVIGDFLSQYFSPASADRGRKYFSKEGLFSKPLADHVNRILDSYRRYSLGAEIESPFSGGIVVVSTFAFVELCRNWARIVNGRFSIDQLHAFLLQPPEWFNLAPVDETLLPYYADIPTHVYLKGELVAIEWCDAIHAATADSRGTDTLLATEDQRLKCIPHLRSRIII